MAALLFHMFRGMEIIWAILKRRELESRLKDFVDYNEFLLELQQLPQVSLGDVFLPKFSCSLVTVPLFSVGNGYLFSRMHRKTIWLARGPKLTRMAKWRAFICQRILHQCYEIWTVGILHSFLNFLFIQNLTSLSFSVIHGTITMYV